jgi:predicted nucleic acid-binding protein
MPLFLDASALVKLYRAETGSRTMHEIAGRSDEWGDPFISDHVALEVVSTLAARYRGGELSRSDYDDALREFDVDYPDRFNVVEVGAEAVERAIVLSRTYFESGAKTMDLIHVVSARIVADVEDFPVVVVSCDRGMKALAARVGFDVFDPLSDDLRALTPLRLGL